FNAAFPGVNNPQISSYLSASEQDARDGINALAKDTGGEAFYNNNDIGELLKKSLDDNQVYYTLAYYPAGEANIRKYRNITIRVKDHPEYKVRTQRGYLPLDLLKDKQEVAQTPRQKLFQAIAAPLPLTNIAVAATADFLGKGGSPDQVIFQVYIEGKNID